MKRQIDMLNGSIADKILRFAIPLALTGILQQLFNAADVMVVGRFASKEAMAAVGSNTPIIGLMVNLFVGISVGANVVIAKFVGQKKEGEISRAVGTAVLLSVLAGTFLALLGQFVAEPILNAMSVPADVLPMALSYLRIYMGAMPFILLYNFESAIFRSRGDTNTPLFCLVGAGILNVVLNVFFVVVLKRSADGVAVATAVSNAVSSIVMLSILCRSKGSLRLERRFLRLDRAVLGEILRIGVPAGVQAMLFSFSNIIVQSAINSLGSDVMAASSAAFNFEIFSYFVINAFGQACTTFIGQNYGAKKLDRCRKVTNRALAVDSACAVVLSVVTVSLSRFILGFFSESESVISLGCVRILYIAPFQLLNVLMEIFSGSLRGYGKSLAPAVISFFGVCAVRIVWVYTVFASDRTFETLLACYPLSWFLTALILTVCHYVFVRRIGKTEK